MTNLNSNPVTVNHGTSQQSPKGDLTFEAFMSQEESRYQEFFESKKKAEIQILNHFDSKTVFQDHLRSLDLTSLHRIRPPWDLYWIQIAFLTARRSNCMKRRVGAVIVRENHLVSAGYNGTARKMQNCNDGGCERCNKGSRAGIALDECLCLHAEENAMLEAGREKCREAILFCTTCPCLGCAKKIIQCGIIEVVYSETYALDQKIGDMLKSAGVRLRHFPHP